MSVRSLRTSTDPLHFATGITRAARNVLDAGLGVRSGEAMAAQLPPSARRRFSNASRALFMFSVEAVF